MTEEGNESDKPNLYCLFEKAKCSLDEPESEQKHSAHLPVSLSDGAEQRDDASPVGLGHGRALLQQQTANLQLPPTGRCGQSWTQKHTIHQ